MIQGPFLPRRQFGGLPEEATLLEKARVVLLPVPYDSTTDYKAGAREGPQALLDASQHLELYDHELGREPYQVGIHTLPELEPAMGSPGEMVERVYRVAREVLARGKLLGLLGGEHSLTLGAVRACRELYPGLSVLQLDAHADLRQQYLGTPFSHASVARRLLELCPLVQVGIRSLSAEEAHFIQERGLTPFYAEAFDSSQIEKIVAALSPAVYLTVDLDVFDPSEVPAVGTPEPGGLRWYEVTRLLRAVAEKRRVAAFDVMELCPGEGPTASAFLAARLVYKLIGYIARPG